MAGGVQRAPLGPFMQGLVEAAPNVAVEGSFAGASNMLIRQAGTVQLRRGTVLTSRLVDDQTPAVEVSSVVALGAFQDAAYAVAWSSARQRVLLYILNPEMTGAKGTTPPIGGDVAPTATLWAGVTERPVVSVVEGLGQLYFAHGAGVTASGQQFQSLVWDGTTVTGMTGALASPGTACYFNGLTAFQAHLWGWGFGAAGDVYRPELARFSTINFGADAADLFEAIDSITLADRVRTVRERIVAAGQAGPALFLAGDTILSRVIGYDRETWQREVMDRSYGAAGPLSGVSVGDYWYWWSRRGPCRVNPNGQVDQLFATLQDTTLDVLDPVNVVGVYDEESQHVLWVSSRQSMPGMPASIIAAFDARAGRWSSNLGSIGLAIGSGAIVVPVRETTTALPGPAGPATALASTAITQTAFTATWTAPDAASELIVEYREVVTPTPIAWVALAPLPPGTTEVRIAGGFPPNGVVEWRVIARRNGLTQTSTTATADLLDTLAVPTDVATTMLQNSPGGATIRWTITEPSAQTRVQIAGPYTAGGQPLTEDEWTDDRLLGAGVGSTTFLARSGQNGTMYVRARHELAALGAPSPWSTPITFLSLYIFPPDSGGGGGGGQV